jgi:hypothetical protein
MREPEVAVGPPAWNPSDALALEPNWLFGTLGNSVSFAELDVDGAVQSSGTRLIEGGAFLSVALVEDLVLLAAGGEGLVGAAREEVVGSEEPLCCESRRSVRLPEGCSSSSCESANQVAVAAEGHAVVMTYTWEGSQVGRIYLVDVSGADAMRVVDVVALSNAAATPRDVAVSGNMVFAAATVEGRQEGVVDVLELVCE